jgi:hypothetical protein
MNTVVNRTTLGANRTTLRTSTERPFGSGALLRRS